jgi:hypothetical protein
MMRFRLRLRRMIAKSWILSRCYLPAARPSPFGSGERRDLVFLLWRQHAPTVPFASDAAYKHSSVAPAVSRAIGCASISMAYDLLRP